MDNFNSNKFSSASKALLNISDKIININGENRIDPNWIAKCISNSITTPKVLGKEELANIAKSLKRSDKKID